MNKEKQIEEMARTAIEALPIFNAKNYNVVYKMCEALYNAGYRKEIRGEWVLMLENAFDIEDTETGKVEFYNNYYCSNCGREVSETDVSECEKYCSNCGANMRGE